MNLINKLWKDPVWSKVIAAGFIVLFSWFFNWYRIIWNIILSLYQLVISYFQIAIIIVLITVIIFQFYNYKKMTGILFSKKKKDIGVNWFSKLDELNVQKYSFLFWFPINHRIQTHTMFHDESLNHLPEFKELFERKVLFTQPISAIEYVIEIDKNVYDYIDDIYLKEFNNLNKDEKNKITTFKSTPFHMLFPKTKLY